LFYATLRVCPTTLATSGRAAVSTGCSAVAADCDVEAGLGAECDIEAALVRAERDVKGGGVAAGCDVGTLAFDAVTVFSMTVVVPDAPQPTIATIASVPRPIAATR